MRYDAGTTAIQVCDGAGHWVSAAGSSASSLSSLTAATGPNTIDSLLSTQEWDWSTLATGAGLKLSTGGATNNLDERIAAVLDVVEHRRELRDERPDQFDADRRGQHRHCRLRQ